uniref:Uncharacterized protein n=1 Tax=Anguilla anguilla TaxID=7936 RepID=A0A0E9TCZ8_ANGAN
MRSLEGGLVISDWTGPCRVSGGRGVSAVRSAPPIPTPNPPATGQRQEGQPDSTAAHSSSFLISQGKRNKNSSWVAFEVTGPKTSCFPAPPS